MEKEKKRVALLIPHTDVTLEADLQAFLPESYVLHTQRMWLENVEERAEKRMVDEELPRALSYLENIAAFEAAVFGCTSASAVYGKKGMEALEATIGQRLGCPACSAFGAVLRAIGACRARRIALVTPYIEAVNRFMEKSLAEFGVDVACSFGMGILNDRGIVAVKPEEIVAFVAGRRAEICARAELLLLSCTALRAMEAREEVAAMLQIPVVTSNQAIFDFIRSAG